MTTQTAADLGPFQISPGDTYQCAAAGLLVPLLAALLPLWMGTRITVREAISAYGVQAGSSRQATPGVATSPGFRKRSGLACAGSFANRGRPP